EVARVRLPFGPRFLSQRRRSRPDNQLYGLHRRLLHDELHRRTDCSYEFAVYGLPLKQIVVNFNSESLKGANRFRALRFSSGSFCSILCFSEKNNAEPTESKETGALRPVDDGIRSRFSRSRSPNPRPIQTERAGSLQAAFIQSRAWIRTHSELSQTYAERKT